MKSNRVLMLEALLVEVPTAGLEVGGGQAVAGPTVGAFVAPVLVAGLRLLAHGARRALGAGDPVLHGEVALRGVRRAPVGVGVVGVLAVGADLEVLGRRESDVLLRLRGEEAPVVQGVHPVVAHSSAASPSRPSRSAASYSSQMSWKASATARSCS